MQFPTRQEIFPSLIEDENVHPRCLKLLQSNPDIIYQHENIHITVTHTISSEELIDHNNIKTPPKISVITVKTLL